jgi:hypothetical protein
MSKEAHNPNAHRLEEVTLNGDWPDWKQRRAHIRLNHMNTDGKVVLAE